ncbi:MAG TPA: YtxH domain-containing protein [Chitinophagaceae bacterium]|jgi:gas vesicle protein|nr:YtxH domain-containing protein [Chitinophagaceae bacterium]
MNSTSKILITAIGAAAAGAVIGLLLAPEKGSDLRQKIQSAANDWADQLVDLVNSSREKFGEVKGEMKVRAENGLAEVRDKM